MPSAPRTVKDVPAQEFVIALAQYFRSTGKVSAAIPRHPRCPSGENAVLLRCRARHDAVLDLTRGIGRRRARRRRDDRYTRAMDT